MDNRLLASARFSGVGLHSGAPVSAVVRPAPDGFGIAFHRVDVGREGLILASWDAVAPSALCTRIENRAGVSVSTVEHLLAALTGLGVRDAIIEIDGPEVPILDGSAAPFVAGLQAAGLAQGPKRATLEILRPVEVCDGAASARLEPPRFGQRGLSIDFEIAFADPAIGRQRRRFALRRGAFAHDVARARTFCRAADVEQMQAQGLALGGSLDNAVVVDGAQVLTPGGLRHPDEAVRHKILDAVGDLALAGHPIRGCYVADRAGHKLTNMLLKALFAEPAAWRLVGTPMPVQTPTPATVEPIAA